MAEWYVGGTGQALLHRINLSLGGRPNGQEADVPVNFVPVPASMPARPESGPGAAPPAASVPGAPAARPGVTAFPQIQIHIP